jgi:hypothetical protein
MRATNAFEFFCHARRMDIECGRVSNNLLIHKFDLLLTWPSVFTRSKVAVHPKDMRHEAHLWLEVSFQIQGVLLHGHLFLLSIGTSTPLSLHA